MRTWERENYKVVMVEYDFDLKAFAVLQDQEEQVIYPDDLEDMENIINDLDDGEDVDGWDDGMGNVIRIKRG